MNFIELTLTGIAKKKVFLNPNAIGSFVWQGDFTGIGLTHGATMSVQETPKQIMELINGNQKSEWIENTGVQPCADDRMVFVMFADGSVLGGNADHWEWEKGGEYSVSKYKFYQEIK